MGALHNYLRNNFQPGEWLGRFCNPKQHNRIANILQDIQGVGLRIVKPTDQEGRGWRIINDGTSDILPPLYTPPEGRASVTAAPVAMYAETVGVSSLAQLDMVQEYETDADILDAVAASASHIDVKVAGIYHIDLHAEMAVPIPGTAAYTPSFSAYIYINSTEARKFRLGLIQTEIAKAGSGNAEIGAYKSSSGDVSLAADDVISVWTWGIDATAARVDISVHLVQST
jgi:hypothetical protein